MSVAGDNSTKKWVCPSDRELTLRAKLRAGWSSRTHVEPSEITLNEAEQAAIMQVLERANRAQEVENERVRSRRLQERLNRMKLQARGNGKKSCILCNDMPRFFSRFNRCKDCGSVVCNKCSVYDLDTTEAIWLCKICSESRELTKKANLWTQFNGIR